MIVRPVSLLALALVLAGCQKERTTAAAGGAGGEVLPGSASDAMLPLDTVRSQAPLAPRSEASEASGKPGRPSDKPSPGETPAPTAAPTEAAPVPPVTPTSE